MAWTQEDEEHYLSTPWEDELFDEIQRATGFGMKTNKVKLVWVGRCS